MNFGSTRLKIQPLVALVAIVGCAFVLYAMSGWGVAIVDDGPIYIHMAESIVNGNGITVTHYPPFYPALLALSGSSDASMLVGARWLNVILFAALILLVGIILSRLTKQSMWIVLVGVLLTIFSVDMLVDFSSTRSESIYIVCSVAGMYLLALYLDNSRMRFLVGSAIAMSLAIMTRYLGLTLVMSGCLVMLLTNKTIRSRFLDCIIFGAVSVLPLGLWLIRNQLVLGNTTDRSFFFAPLSQSNIEQGLGVFTNWLLPQRLADSLPLPVQGLVLLLMLVGLVFLFWNARSRTKADSEHADRLGSNVVLIFGLNVVVSIVATGITAMFFDRATTFSERIVSPIFIPCLILALYAIYFLLKPMPLGRAAQIVLLGVSIFYVGFYAVRGLTQLKTQHDVGLGLYSEATINSAAIKAVQNIDPNVAIYSNSPEEIIFAAHRDAVYLPVPNSFIDLKPLPTFDKDLAETAQRLKDGMAIIVYFDKGFAKTVTPDEFVQKTGLALEATRLEGATIYRIKKLVTIGNWLDKPGQHILLQ